MAHRLKRFFIRMALGQLKKMHRLEGLNLFELEKYGIKDIIRNQYTGEPMYVIH